MKIYDCFTFYNELDLLEIRIRELYDHVDHFIISEANTSHAGNPKDFILSNNMERFKPWADKMTVIQVLDMPGVINGDCWHNERHQRDSLLRGLTHIDPEDVVIIGDLDEIVRPSCVDEIRKDTQHNLWAFRMPCFNFKFNYMWIHPQIYHVYPQALKGHRLRKFGNFTTVREKYGETWALRPFVYDDGIEVCLQHGGWHFSSLGNSDVVANKYRNYAHSEKAWMANFIDVDTLIAQNKTTIDPNFIFEPVILDSYFPKAIYKNKEKYKDLILEGDFPTVMDKLKGII
jgi:hypothetical protein